jgi:hypothetical protein
MNSSHPINPLSSINYNRGFLRLMNIVQVVVIVITLMLTFHKYPFKIIFLFCFLYANVYFACLRNNIYIYIYSF